MKNEAFYGTTTLGERGQAVIPAEARKALKLKAGDKLLVFSMHDDMLVMTKLSQLQKFASHLSKKLNSMEKIIKDTKQ
jgi:AbrB family looped-hinge helix DNA binding protein